MAQYDGSIKIDTRLDNDELIKELRELGKMLESNLQKIIEDIKRLAVNATASGAAMTAGMNQAATASENMSKACTTRRGEARGIYRGGKMRGGG